MDVAATVTEEGAGGDAEAMLDFLADQPEVTGQKVGTTGYCMGGSFALTAAGRFPDRVAAAASFHGGQLAEHGPREPAPAGRLDAGDDLHRVRRGRGYFDERAEERMSSASRAGVDTPW